MQDTLWQVRRTADGSIDYATYKHIAHAARSKAMTQSVARRANAARTGLLAATRMICKATRSFGTALVATGRRAAEFWMIPPLGVVDRLHRPER